MKAGSSSESVEPEGSGHTVSPVLREENRQLGIRCSAKIFFRNGDILSTQRYPQMKDTEFSSRLLKGGEERGSF